MAKKLAQYAGTLTLEQIAEGMNLAMRNARSLYEDAKTLFDAERYPTALSLAILSIEEAGKAPILRRMTTETSSDQVKALWREYRSHTKKNVAWTLLQHVNWGGATKLEDLHPIYDETSDHPFLLDQLKQLGFYTDCLGRAHWAVPADVIEKELVEHLLMVARVHSGVTEVTTRELQLWQQHVGDTRHYAYLRVAKKALAKWYEAMQAEGMYPEGPNEMTAFVEQGIQLTPSRPKKAD
jgi:AbiV family abortive infection protein